MLFHMHTRTHTHTHTARGEDTHSSLRKHRAQSILLISHSLQAILASALYHHTAVTHTGAGSGGVRASRVSAQLYGAKVACVELPFGFIACECLAVVMQFAAELNFH